MIRSKTMVLAGDFAASSTERGLADGFRALGWIVHEVPRSAIRGSQNLLQRAAGRGLRASLEATYRNEVLAACRLLQPAVFLTVKGLGITKSLVRDIQLLSVATAMYYPDYYFEQRGVFVESFEDYDLFVTTKSFQLDRLSEICGSDHVAYVPHGYVPIVHAPHYRDVEQPPHERDILYIGNHSAFKQSWMEQLVRISPHLDLTICGAGWQASQMPASENNVRIEPPRYGVIYSRMVQASRINIALHMGPSASGWADLVSTRTFEIPACGGFMLHVDNDEVRDFFTPGVEIDVFSSAEELKDKITFYLARPELRAKMVERAYARCVPAYSYDARAREIESLIATKTARGPGVAFAEPAPASINAAADTQ